MMTKLMKMPMPLTKDMDAKVKMYQWVYQVGRDVHRDEVRRGAEKKKRSGCRYFD